MKRSDYQSLTGHDYGKHATYIYRNGAGALLSASLRPLFESTSPWPTNPNHIHTMFLNARKQKIMYGRKLCESICESKRGIKDRGRYSLQGNPVHSDTINHRGKERPRASGGELPLSFRPSELRSVMSSPDAHSSLLQVSPRAL